MSTDEPTTQGRLASAERPIADLMREIGKAARAAAQRLSVAPSELKNRALLAAAAALRAHRHRILAANERDLNEAAAGASPSAGGGGGAGAGAGVGMGAVSGPLLERLRLDEKRVLAMADSLEEIVRLADPIGTLLAEWTRPNGLVIQRRRVPLGVVGIIYESRPNVTADAGALCLKSSNAVILRGGSESMRSNLAIHGCMEHGLEVAGLPKSCIQLVPTTDRAAVGFMLAEMTDSIDVIVPRGGRGLIERVKKEARVPVIGHLDGVCHVYVDRDADPEMAKRIVLNAKMRRTGVCGAAETLLVDRGAVAQLAALVAALLDAGCEVRGDEATRQTDARVKPATEQDWYTEYLDAIIAVRVVDGVDAAIAHIEHYGSRHTDSIVTANAATAERFLDRVDSAIVLHNASTQFADGGEFGMGAEIGISTDKFHARGPVGVEQLTSYKYVVRGSGQTRA
ncbi:MAG: glutamate-5-semialdehyde dehydrogenase [Steroidobacteraceae bacterium]